PTGDDCSWSVTYNYVIDDDCDNFASPINITYSGGDTEVPDITFAPDDQTFDCGEDQYIPMPTATDNCDPDPDFYFIRSDGKTEWTDPYSPSSDPYGTAEYTVEVWFVDNCNNESDHETFFVTINPCGIVACSYTQGFYGNEGGLTCNGVTTTDFINGKLPITVGAFGNTLSFAAGEASCIIELLPGGGPAKTISGVNTCANHPGIQIKKGKISNILLAQTLTLALNLAGNEDFADMPMFGGHLRIAESSDCDDPGAYVVGPYTDYYISSTVMDELGTNATLADLLAMANNALGGGYSNGMLSAIADAAALINEAFDECRFGYFEYEAYTAPAPPANGNDNSISSFIDNTTMNAYPNPFSEVANVEFTVPLDVRVTLEVYTLQGQHVETLYTGMAEKDVIHTYRFYAKDRHNQSVYVYVLRTVYGAKVGKLIMIK
ncbi:MAG TPA: T9SS type A sorting domain-containing protein, partial [Bacteroidales bacterium]|nr:T9SS type A sorting domain-containing protein [Bacteroidales bacterium]